MPAPSLIRNFSIIAHIDHGKSTLADQFLLQTGTISQREFRRQLLDDMDLERERGITIQMHPVTIYHKHTDGQTYEINLIDTPGHVDFSYEVSRSLAACEGAILLVDAFQGVQAQTVANAYLAIENDLTIVPVLNKIDMPTARPDAVMAEMETAIGVKPEECLQASGKTGLGVPQVLAAIIDRMPPPPGDPEAPLKALDLQQSFRHVQGGRRLRSLDGRDAQGRAEDQIDARWAGVHRHGTGAVSSGNGRLLATVGRAGRLHHCSDQGHSRCPHRRHGHRCRQPDGHALAWLQRAAADGLLGSLSDPKSGL